MQAHRPGSTLVSLLLAAGVLVAHALAIGAPPAPHGIQSVSHSPEQPHSGQAVQITAKVPDTATSIVLEYQLVEPGKYIELKDPAFKTNWLSIPMKTRP